MSLEIPTACHEFLHRIDESIDGYIKLYEYFESIDEDDASVVDCLILCERQNLIRLWAFDVRSAKGRKIEYESTGLKCLCHAFAPRRSHKTEIQRIDHACGMLQSTPPELNVMLTDQGRMELARHRLNRRSQPLASYPPDDEESRANASIDSRGDSVKNQDAASKRVFVVHGHDHGLKNGVGRFIEATGLEAIILHERPDRGQTVVEKFEQEAEVGFAVVLCTADDLAESQHILESNDNGKPRTVLRQRARQNVIFELGYFVGKIGRARAAVIVDSGVEIPSDLSGVIYIPREKWQSELYKALADAGYSISQEQSRKAMAIEA